MSPGFGNVDGRSTIELYDELKGIMLPELDARYIPRSGMVVGTLNTGGLGGAFQSLGMTFDLPDLKKGEVIDLDFMLYCASVAGSNCQALCFVRAPVNQVAGNSAQLNPSPLVGGGAWALHYPQRYRWPCIEDGMHRIGVYGTGTGGGSSYQGTNSWVHWKIEKDKNLATPPTTNIGFAF